MRIISGFKDYYDYCQGTIGQDPLAVYERKFRHFYDGKTSDGPWKYTFFHYPDLYCLHLCGVKNVFAEVDLKFYFLPFVGPNDTKPTTEEYESLVGTWPKKVQKLLAFDTRFQYHFERKISDNGDHSDLNKKHDCPIILSHLNHNDSYPIILDPVLRDFNYHKIVPAERMFTMLNDWFLDKKNAPEPVPMSDKNKIASHGMDPKRSFRPKIKD